MSRLRARAHTEGQNHRRRLLCRQPGAHVLSVTRLRLWHMRSYHCLHPGSLPSALSGQMLAVPVTDCRGRPAPTWPPPPATALCYQLLGGGSGGYTHTYMHMRGHACARTRAWRHAFPHSPSCMCGGGLPCARQRTLAHLPPVSRSPTPPPPTVLPAAPAGCQGGAPGRQPAARQPVGAPHGHTSQPAAAGTRAVGRHHVPVRAGHHGLLAAGARGTSCLTLNGVPHCVDCIGTSCLTLYGVPHCVDCIGTSCLTLYGVPHCVDCIGTSCLTLYGVPRCVDCIGTSCLTLNGVPHLWVA